ncbi:MAG TPA: hypothetical protein VF242_12705 [Nitrososphaeraceae archaeon]
MRLKTPIIPSGLVVIRSPNCPQIGFIFPSFSIFAWTSSACLRSL